MGKYMKKSKVAGNVALMELCHASVGVLTRAKTLALKKLQRNSIPEDSSSYLQLRSRRLEKPPLLKDASSKRTCTDLVTCREVSTRFSKVNSSESVSAGSIVAGLDGKGKSCVPVGETEEAKDLVVEASFGENCYDFEGRERSTRESTPCSFIRETDTTEPPGSTTRQRKTSAGSRSVHNVGQRSFPTTQEMDEFFAFAEQQQQRLFTEKYNFDVMFDLPLPGRYEWVRISP